MDLNVNLNNVVCGFSTRCHLNLKKICKESCDVEFKKDNNMVTMRLKRPYMVASVWSSGKVWCTGATSETNARIGARRIARRIQKLGFPCKFSNYRILNILATCEMPYGIKLYNLAESYPRAAVYEPELHSGLTYQIKDPKATLKVYTTGSVVITAPSRQNIEHAVMHIYEVTNRFKVDLSEKPAQKCVSSVHPIQRSRLRLEPAPDINRRVNDMNKFIPCNGYNQVDDESDSSSDDDLLTSVAFRGPARRILQ